MRGPYELEAAEDLLTRYGKRFEIELILQLRPEEVAAHDRRRLLWPWPEDVRPAWKALHNWLFNMAVEFVYWREPGIAEAIPRQIDNPLFQLLLHATQRAHAIAWKDAASHHAGVKVGGWKRFINDCKARWGLQVERQHSLKPHLVARLLGLPPATYRRIKRDYQARRLWPPSHRA